MSHSKFMCRQCATCRKEKSMQHFIGKGQDFLNCHSCRKMKKKQRRKKRNQFLEHGKMSWNEG